MCDIIQHPWLQGSTPTYKQIKYMFKKMDENIEAERNEHFQQLRNNMYLLWKEEEHYQLTKHMVYKGPRRTNWDLPEVIRMNIDNN